MRTIIVLLVLLAFLSNAKAQSCTQKAPPADVKKMANLVGEWQGEFTTEQNKTHSLSITFYEEGQELKVKITNVALMSRDARADISLCSPDKFHVFGKRSDGESFTYNARLVNGELVGDYKIGESCSKENRSAFTVRKVKT
jgi:hypothetical protein